MYTNSAEEAKDLRQEISYQVIKSYKRFKGDSKVSTWVYRIALYTALTYLKTEKKTGSKVYELPELLSDDLEPEDRWPELLSEIKKLPPIDKSLVFLLLENKSYVEMAEIMGMTESNIGVRLNRVKKKLKEKFAEDGT